MVTIPFFKSFRGKENALKHGFQPIFDEYIKAAGSDFTQNVKVDIFGCIIQ